VGRGEIAVVGPAGSGKSTLLNCLSGLERIDGGQILVDGSDLDSVSDNARPDAHQRPDQLMTTPQLPQLAPLRVRVEGPYASDYCRAASPRCHRYGIVIVPTIPA
jgi:ABC-type oligopeptide transport system ATPase subunit